MAGNDRSELEELRRLDALEAKAGGTKLPAAPGGSSSPNLEAQGQAMAAEETPEWERRMAGVGRAAVGVPADALQQLVGHLTGKGKEVDAEVQERARAMDALYKASAKDTAGRAPASTALPFIRQGGIVDSLGRMNAERTGTATGLVEGAAVPAMGGKKALTRILGGAGLGGGFAAAEPVLNGGDFTAEKVKQVGKGAAAGGAMSSVFELAAKIPGLFKRAPAAPVRQPVESEAPGQVAGELGRQRDVAADKSLARTGAGASEAERATTDFDQRMKALREAAFNEGGTVDAQQTVGMIDDLIQKNPSEKVRGALREARKVLQNATSSSKAASLPPAGARLTPKELKAMQGRGDSLDLPMADEVRQGLNEIIERKGDKALDARTQSLLSQVRDSFVSKTPESYRSYLSQYGQGAEKLDKYDPARSVIGKLQAGQPLKGTDAEDFMAGLFSGKTRERDFKDLVERTAHDPAAGKALRQSFGEWLTKPDPTTRVVSAENLLKRWDQARGPAKASGMMDGEHVKMVDSLMDDLVKLKGKKGMAKDVATIGGFFAGMPVGHPFVASHLARDMAGNVDKTKIQQNATDIVMALAVGDAETAKMLAAKPTPEAMSDFAQHLEQMLSAQSGRAAGEQKPPRRGGLRSAIGGLQ